MMINKSLLSLMKPTACLINCARGGIVDEDDLYEALSEHKIHGAGVDVLTQEPFDKDSRLLKLDNMIVTPHDAALNVETMNKMGLDAAQGIYVMSMREQETGDSALEQPLSRMPEDTVKELRADLEKTDALLAESLSSGERKNSSFEAYVYTQDALETLFASLNQG